MDINVTVDQVDLAAQVAVTHRQTGEDNWTPEPVTLADLVADRIFEDIKRDDGYSSLKARVKDLRDEQIRETLAPIVAAAIEAPIQRTNDYGTPTGPAVALRDMIVEEVGKYLNRAAGYDRMTVVQKLVRDEVDRALKSELTEVIKDEKAKVIAAVRAKAADLIADAVRQGVGR